MPYYNYLLSLFTISEIFFLPNYERISLVAQGILHQNCEVIMQFKDDYELYQTISRNIKYYRELANLTQMQLAEQSHLSISYITKLEASGCDKSISLSALHQIAKVLNQDITIFFEPHKE